MVPAIWGGRETCQTSGGQVSPTMMRNLMDVIVADRLQRHNESVGDRIEGRVLGGRVISAGTRRRGRWRR